MKKDQKQPHDAGRRSFLHGSAVTGLGIAAAAALPASVAAATPEQPAEGAKGYQLTQHVLDYYKTLAS